MDPNSYLSTIELCDLYEQFGRLCPGVCQEPCFGKKNFPTCFPEVKGGLELHPNTVQLYCDELKFMLGGAVFELDRHAEILSSVPDLSGSSENCQPFRQSYRLCIWCTQTDPFGRCFDERNPLTCIGPNDDSSTNAIVDAQPYCSFIEQFYFYQGYGTWYLDAHSFYLSVIHANSWLCDIIRPVYHRCYWCAQINETDSFCRRPLCSSNDNSSNSTSLAEISTSADEVEVACHVLSNIILDYKETPATTELCTLSERYEHLCTQTCERDYSLQPCFTNDDPPSCNSESVNETLNSQQYCYTLLRDYLWSLWEDGGLFLTYLHAKSFASLPANSELCDIAKQVYHLCFWCTGDYSIDFCQPPACNTSRDSVDDTNNVEITCSEIKRIRIENKEVLATTELCEMEGKVGHLCLDTCNNTDPGRSCFNENYRLSCSSYDDGLTKSEYDAQHYCWILEKRYLQEIGNVFELDRHINALSSIHKDSELCLAARQVYHQCYWCAPNVTEFYCRKQPACSALPAVLHTAVEDKSCRLWNSIFEQYDNF